MGGIGGHRRGVISYPAKRMGLRIVRIHHNEDEMKKETFHHEQVALHSV
jgi:hypothetical protein